MAASGPAGRPRRRAGQRGRGGWIAAPPHCWSAPSAPTLAALAERRDADPGRFDVVGRQGPRRRGRRRARWRHRPGRGAAGGSDGPAPEPVRRAVRVTGSRGNRGVEEGRFLVGEIGERRRPPLQDGFQPGPVVQLAGGPTERFPTFRGGGEVTRMSCPAASSSSHDRSRGHARATASWASSTESSAVVTNRDPTNNRARGRGRCHHRAPGRTPATAPVHHRTPTRRVAASPSAAWDVARSAGSHTIDQPNGQRHPGSHRWPDTPRPSIRGRHGAATSRRAARESKR